MKRVVLAVVLVLALPAAAAEYEKMLLTVAPGVVYCGYHSKYDTRLVAFNGAGVGIQSFCSDEMCGALPASTGTVVIGEHVPIPQPSFIYVPKEMADDIQMSLIVESSDTLNPAERSYTELPIVRESQFKAGKIQIVGVRMDDGFRKTLRIYGLNGGEPAVVRVRVYALRSTTPAYEHDYWLLPQAGLNEAGLDAAPSFNMECDLSAYVENYGAPVRVELEPLTQGAKIWGFVSITNNITQHFYTVVPR
jgi:hypothetical protein